MEFKTFDIKPGEAFKKGFVMGGVTGFIIGVTLKSRIVLYSIGGALVGGFIAFKITQPSSIKTALGNYGVANSSTINDNEE